LIVGVEARSASTDGLREAAARVGSAQRVGRNNLDGGAATGGLALTLAIGIGLLDLRSDGLLQGVLDLGLLVLGAAAARGEVEAAACILRHNHSAGGRGGGRARA